MNLRRYCAIYMPAGDSGLSRYGFKNEDDAWDYAESQYCETCQELLKDEDAVISCSGEWFTVRMDLEDYWYWFKSLIKIFR